MKLPLAVTRSFNNIHAKMHGEPTISTGIDGFEISVDKKDGVLFHYKSNDPADNGEKDATVDFYYEVSIRATGENPEYPEQEESTKFQYTHTISDSGMRGIGSIRFIPEDADWLNFEVIEGYSDGKPTMGRPVPAHHLIMVKAKYTEDGNESFINSESQLIRKSDYDEKKWDAWRSCPVRMM